MSESPPTAIARVTGLRINAFAATVMLLLQYSLGIWVNIDSTLPGADKGAGFWGAFLDSITNGPVTLALHAVLGSLLVVSAVTLTMRAVRTRRSLWIVLATIGLTSILIAWLSGVRFVDTQSATPSLLMALCTALAIFCYVLVLFTANAPARQAAKAELT
jgi:hypothetical protein